MGMSTPGGGGPKRRLAEINVTPFVDVMLVLLIIFMIAAGVQKGEIEAEQQRTLEQAEAILEEAFAAKSTPRHEKVDVDLPRLDSESVNLSESQKLQLVVDHNLVFFFPCLEKGCKRKRTVLTECLKASPEMKRFVGQPVQKDEFEAEQAAFAPCLKALGDKLVENAKVQADKEMYVLADRRLSYGQVLRVMAVVRQAGVTKFGLVAEPDILGDAAVEREGVLSP